MDDRTKARLEELDAGHGSMIDRIVTDLADAESWERLAQRAVKRLTQRRHPVGGDLDLQRTVDAKAPMASASL